MSIRGGINHITLRVQNLARSKEFYSGLLGLKLVGSRVGMHFYSSGHYNHELALIEDARFIGNLAGSSGLAHIAFNLESKDDLSALKQEFEIAGHRIDHDVDHIIAKSFYTRDPDGYVIELTVDQPQREWQDNPDAYKLDYAI